MAFMASAVFMSSCVTVIKQDLSVSFRLHEGMTQDEVLTIMGKPIKTDFYKSVEEWHYCKTGVVGRNPDEFLALFFYENKLIAKKNYSVIGEYGSCESLIKMGNYKEPDNVTEIRLKYK